jgi:predicted nuclease of predicted toxin-antitoxin system
MKLLLDTCIWGGAADALRMQGHDVVWSGDWDEDPGDEVILTTALAQGRVLIANPRRVVRFLTALASIRSTHRACGRGQWKAPGRE